MLGLRLVTRWSRCKRRTWPTFKHGATRWQYQQSESSFAPPDYLGWRSRTTNSSNTSTTSSTTIATATTTTSTTSSEVPLPISETDSNACNEVAEAADRKAEHVLGILESAFPDAALPPLQIARSPSIHFREDAAFDLWWEYEDSEADGGSGQLWYSMYKKFSDLTPREQKLVDQPGSRLQSVKKRLGRRGKKKKYSQATGRRRRQNHDPQLSQELDDHRKCRMLMREFPRASKPINNLMPRLLDFLQSNKELQYKCFQVRFRSTLHQKKVMVLLLYHRPIETPEFRAAAAELLQAFPDELVTVVGRAKRQLVQTPRDFLVESYCLPPTTIGRRIFPDDDWELVFSSSQLETSSSTAIIEEPSKSEQPQSKQHEDDVVCLDAHTVVVEQPENCFIQPNANICTRMLMWAREAIVRHRLRKKQQGDSAYTNESSHSLLELHCGIGTFTLALAPFFHRTFATELNRRSVEALGRNVARTFPLPNRSSFTACNFDPSNIFFTATPAQDVASTLVAQAASQHHSGQLPPVVTLSHDSVLQAEDLLELGGEVTSSHQTFNFRTVFVDPPRSGLDATTLEALQLFPEVMYISCNPESLKRDLTVLSNTHVVQASAFFDQFPWSPHIESGVLLERRDQVTFCPGDYV